MRTAETMTTTTIFIIYFLTRARHGHRCKAEHEHAIVSGQVSKYSERTDRLNALAVLQR